MSKSEKTEPEKAVRGEGKLQWSLDAMLKQMETTDEERIYRRENFSNVDVVKEHTKHLKCTKCSINFQFVINQGVEVGTHPLLGVLMCNSCSVYYGDGNFSLDSEGEEKYCRWCGEGGTIFACSKCVCGFCDECIKKHFGENGLKAVQNDDDWICYFCNPKPLWYLRSICSLANEAARNKNSQLKRNRESRRRKRRKREILDSDSKESSSETYSSSSRSFTRRKKSKRKKLRRWLDDLKRDESSSSEDEKENHLNSKKKETKNKNESCDGNSKNSKTKPKPTGNEEDDSADPESENKKVLIIQKLRSIWRLTQTVSEVGLSSCRGKMKALKLDSFHTFEHLKKEREDLKSCLNVLISSLNSASNSVDSIREDLTFETARDERETFRMEEIELKRLESRFQAESNDEAAGDGLKKTKRSQGAGNGGDLNASKSLFTESDEEGKPEGSGEAKPLLKVKSFAKMLDENLYDKKEESEKEQPIVIDLYDIDTEESDGENRKRNDVENDQKTGSEKGECVKGEKTNETKKSDEGEKTSERKKRNCKSGKEKMRKKKKSSGHSSEEKREEDRRKRKKKDSSDDEEKTEVPAREHTDDEEEEKKELSDKEETQEGLSGQENETVTEKEEEREETDKEENSVKDTPNEENPAEGEEEREKSDEGKSEKKKSDVDERENDGNDKKTLDSEAEDEKSKSESSEEGRTIRKKRRPKREGKASFEEFKQKREQFLKSAKENSQPVEKGKKKATKVLDSSDSEDGEKQTKKLRKKRIVGSSEEENGQDGKVESSEESAEENQNERSASEEPKISDGTTSDDSVAPKQRRRIKRKKGSSDSSEEDARKKQKRDSSESSEDEKTRKKKKGRKNIKKILKKDSLKVETKEALKNEEERKKRVKERQKLFEELYPDAGKDGKLILDFNPETKEPLVVVHKKLVKKLKPHQVKGVRFMWDNCFESVQKLEEESGSGCILAHCMGLGKTLQVVTLVHTVMTHDLGVNTVLVVCPLSTVSNWIREFEMWLGNVRTDPITLYDLVKYKKREERLYHLKDWHENGGVLVLSYDLFRNLTKALEKGRKKRPKYQKIFEEALLDPGPDLVICDEGHLLKNEDTALSKCMSKVKTSRRIVLTGTPLQNNLIEYHCMVQFVKPNILGTKKEFCNRFVNPINNGQFEDSTEFDVKIMKRRSHVLHSMLDGCIQRFDYSVLVPFLPEKHEYVLTISLTETQAKAYTHFIQNLSAKSSGSSRAASLFNDYHSLQRIWTHPRTMLMQSEKELLRDVLERDSEGSLKDFVVSSEEETGSESDTGSSRSSSSSVKEVVTPRKRILRSNANDPDIQKAMEEEEKLENKRWWDDFYDEKAFDDLREGNKLVILFSLLRYCKQRKDKVLVFSQSLYSLDLIEYFLRKIDENGKKDEETLCGHRDTWILGSDYFRLDGSTNSETRASWCKHFNKESNTRARLFLISTRAGGLGINLYGANRVVIFDASWNPSHDLQSIFRVYRFGQKKPCYIYRFLAEGTMEEKIYERQVTKLSLAHRVVDEHQIERHYTMGNLQELYTFQPTPKEQRKVPNLPKDSVLADLLAEHKDIVVGYHEHDSLLENKQEEELSEEERKAAWKEYEEEKAQKSFHANVFTEQQLALIQQVQFSQGGGGPVVFTIGQNFLNPAYLQSNIPAEILQRGVQCGVTPLPNESLEAYYMRVFTRENWLFNQAK